MWGHCSFEKAVYIISPHTAKGFLSTLPWKNATACWRWYLSIFLHLDLFDEHMFCTLSFGFPTWNAYIYQFDPICKQSTVKTKALTFPQLTSLHPKDGWWQQLVPKKNVYNVHKSSNYTSNCNFPKEPPAEKNRSTHPHPTSYRAPPRIDVEIPFEAIGSWRAHRSLLWNGFGNTCLPINVDSPPSSSNFHEKSWMSFFGV